MRRQQFRLGKVLQHYEMQKRKAEQALRQACEILRQIDAEIDGLVQETTALAGFLNLETVSSLSAAGWSACWQKSAHLGKRLEDARERRGKQAHAVAACEAEQKRWAIAEEMLISLRHNVDQANQNEEAKALHLQLQEAILRNWPANAPDPLAG